MGTEDWIFKSTNLITNTKKQRLKIQSRGWIFKNTILKNRRRRKKKIILKKKKSQELFLKSNKNKIKNIYEVCFKNRVFFWQGSSRFLK